MYQQPVGLEEAVVVLDAVPECVTSLETIEDRTSVGGDRAELSQTTAEEEYHQMRSKS